MKRWLATLVVFAVCTVAVRADVTIVQTMTVEGGMAAAAAAAGAGTPSPVMTTRVKGMRSRTELDGPVSVISIVDLTTKQVIVLRPDQKTATIVSIVPPAAGTGAPTTPSTTPPVALPSLEGSVKPTGKSQVIDGIKCEEYLFTTAMDMGAMMGAQMPPEAAQMMQGMKMMMVGSIWLAKDLPGASEFLAFQKAAAGSDMAATAASAAGVNIPGLDKLMKAMKGVEGLAYLTEMSLNVEGSGQIADMMKQMGPMKITQRTTSIKADPLSDDLFKVPEGYTIVK
jgi:hypothetical protein